MSSSHSPTETQPLAQKAPTNAVDDGRMEEPVLVAPNSGKRWRHSHRPSKAICILASVLVCILLLLLLSAIGLAAYYGSAYYTCITQTNTTDVNVTTSNDVKNASTELFKNVRLPYTVIPHFYDLTLQVYLDEGTDDAFHFNGSVFIKVYCRESTEVIFVHAFERLNVSTEYIQVIELLPDESEGHPIDIKQVSYHEDLQWHRIELKDTLRSDVYYMVKFPQFRSSLTNQLRGLYLSTYTENGIKKYLATSQLQPTDARRVFPCWDEPAFKSIFQVTIIRRANYHSLSNMGKLHTKDMGTGWYADVFEPTVNMSTYLLAFVVSQFDSITDKDSKGRNFTVWARPELISSARYALDIGTKILQFFEEYFEVPYLLQKTDMVAVPDFSAGAMENWGLIIYRECTMLWDPKNDTAAGRQRVATVISHEIAHQWFGNLVTLEWWDDLWLNEGFATFVEYIGVAHVHPEWDMDAQFLLDDVQKVLYSDSLATSRPVFQNVRFPNEINSIFDAISYNKGASVLRMMESFMGRDAFRLGLKNYLRKHRFGNTVQDDLWRSLTEAAESSGKSVNVKAVMDTWLKQMNYPLVTVERTGPNRYRFQQSHYLQHADVDPPQNPSPYNFKWQIPLTYATPYTGNWDEVEVIWLKNETMTMDLSIDPSPWYLFNIKYAGFYRVHYADSNWMQLIKQLINNHKAIPLHSRTQIIDDLFHLACRDIVSFDVFMNLTQYLVNEEHYVPWETARRKFNHLIRFFLEDPYDGHLKVYLRSILEKQLQNVDWNTVQEEKDHMKTLLRGTITKLACQTGHPVCVEKAKSFLKEMMRTNSSNHIPHSLRPLIYCIAIENGGREEWDYLHSQVSNAIRPSEANYILHGLACTKDKWTMWRYIDRYNMSSKFEGIDSTVVWDIIYATRLGRKVFYEYVRHHENESVVNTTNTTNIVELKRQHVELFAHIFLQNNHIFPEEVLYDLNLCDAAPRKKLDTKMKWNKQRNVIRRWLQNHIDEKSLYQ